MAKVVQSRTQNVIVEPWWVKLRIIYIGLGVGLFWWVTSVLLQKYVVEPIACQNLSITAYTCSNAVSVSGSVAAVLAAVLGTWLLVRYFQPRPIIVSVAAAVLLWDLAAILDGLSGWVILLWALFFYIASYVLFSMVARIVWFAWALTLAALLVVGIRLLIVL